MHRAAYGRPVSGLLNIVSVAESGGGHRDVEADLAMNEKALAWLGAPANKIQPRFRTTDALARFLRTL